MDIVLTEHEIKCNRCKMAAHTVIIGGLLAGLIYKREGWRQLISVEPGIRLPTILTFAANWVMPIEYLLTTYVTCGGYYNLRR